MESVAQPLRYKGPLKLLVTNSMPSKYHHHHHRPRLYIPLNTEYRTLTAENPTLKLAMILNKAHHQSHTAPLYKDRSAERIQPSYIYAARFCTLFISSEVSQLPVSL